MPIRNFFKVNFEHLDPDHKLIMIRIHRFSNFKIPDGVWQLRTDSDGSEPIVPGKMNKQYIQIEKIYILNKLSTYINL